MNIKSGIVILFSMYAFNAVAEQTPTAPTSAMSESASESVAAPAETAIPETSQESAEMAGFSRGSVTRSAFTTAINEREPVDSVTELANSENTITYFTELRDMSGQTAIHRWQHNGEVIAEVSFDVRGPRWRVWSSKTVNPEWIGEWKVSVLNGAGETISEDILSYVDQPGASSATENAPADATDIPPAPAVTQPQ